jgi:hypothetical protein
MYLVLKPAFHSESRRKILAYLSVVLANYDTRQLRWGPLYPRISEMLTNAIATHKQTLLFQGHSSVMVAIRTLMLMHYRHMATLPKVESELELGVSIELNPSSVKAMDRF